MRIGFVLYFFIPLESTSWAVLMIKQSECWMWRKGGVCEQFRKLMVILLQRCQWAVAIPFWCLDLLTEMFVFGSVHRHNLHSIYSCLRYRIYFSRALCSLTQINKKTHMGYTSIQIIDFHVDWLSEFWNQHQEREGWRRLRCYSNFQLDCRLFFDRVDKATSNIFPLNQYTYRWSQLPTKHKW